jgi:hypothetical protein
VPLCERLPISELPDSFAPDCDEEEKNASEEKIVPYFYKSGVQTEINLSSITQYQADRNT